MAAQVHWRRFMTRKTPKVNPYLFTGSIPASSEGILAPWAPAAARPWRRFMGFGMNWLCRGRALGAWSSGSFRERRERLLRPRPIIESSSDLPQHALCILGRIVIFILRLFAHSKMLVGSGISSANSIPSFSPSLIRVKHSARESTS